MIQFLIVIVMLKRQATVSFQIHTEPVSAISGARFFFFFKYYEKKVPELEITSQVQICVVMIDP